MDSNNSNNSPQVLDNVNLTAYNFNEETGIRELKKTKNISVDCAILGTTVKLRFDSIDILSFWLTVDIPISMIVKEKTPELVLSGRKFGRSGDSQYPPLFKIILNRLNNGIRITAKDDNCPDFHFQCTYLFNVNRCM